MSKGQERRVPSVEEYAALTDEAKVLAAQEVMAAAALSASRVRTSDRKNLAVRRVSAMTVHNARRHALEAASKEAKQIFENEFAVERVRVFESHPLRQKRQESYGDIEACAVESAEYDRRTKRAKAKTRRVPYGTLDTTNEGQDQ